MAANKIEMNRSFAMGVVVCTGLDRVDWMGLTGIVVADGAMLVCGVSMGGRAGGVVLAVVVVVVVGMLVGVGSVPKSDMNEQRDRKNELS